MYFMAVFQEDTLAVPMERDGADLRERLCEVVQSLGPTWPSTVLGARLAWCYLAAIVLIDESIRNRRSIGDG